MRSPITVLCASLLAAGCTGQIRFPKPTPAPELARLKERCPSFVVLSAGMTEAGPSKFSGRPFAVVGVDIAYLGDLLPWLELIGNRAGDLGLMIVIENSSPAQLGSLPAEIPAGADVYADPTTNWDTVYAESFKLRRRADDARLDEPAKADKFESKAEKLADAARAQPPGFRRALGLVGEGPHVAVVAADGTLLALVDGPINGERKRIVWNAIDTALGSTP